MSKITIKEVSQEVTAWTKNISFEREGETHIVTLYWDLNDGYDLVFKNSSLFKPSWALTEYKLLGELEELLDEMTEREAANA
jgi:hypothetical protein